MSSVTVVGAGLAGSECAFQLAERGLAVTLVEQKPHKRTPAQHHDFFAELVCSNSLRGADLANAVGLLKEEMRRLGSLIMAVADLTRVPAGGALAVDREKFGAEITRRLHSHPQHSRAVRRGAAYPRRAPLRAGHGPADGRRAGARPGARGGRPSISPTTTPSRPSSRPTASTSTRSFGLPLRQGRRRRLRQLPAQPRAVRGLRRRRAGRREGRGARVRGAQATSRAACRSR